MIGTLFPSPELRPFDDEEPFILDPNDPFEAVLIEMVSVNRSKRLDYALDDSPFSNFYYTSDNLGIPGFGPVESAVFNMLQKLARLYSLRQNGRLDDPENESVADTYLDLAVYGVIALAMFTYPDGVVA